VPRVKTLGVIGLFFTPDLFQGRGGGEGRLLVWSQVVRRGVRPWNEMNSITTDTAEKP